MHEVHIICSNLSLKNPKPFFILLTETSFVTICRSYQQKSFEYYLLVVSAFSVQVANEMEGPKLHCLFAADPFSPAALRGI